MKHENIYSLKTKAYRTNVHTSFLYYFCPKFIFGVMLTYYETFCADPLGDHGSYDFPLEILFFKIFTIKCIYIYL